MKKNSIAKLVNYSNRRLYEGLFDYFIHPEQTFRYFQSLPLGLGKYVLGFFARVALLPLTSLVYCVSRLDFIIDPDGYHERNLEKWGLMALATATTLVGIFAPNFGLVTNLNQSLVTGISAAFGLGNSIAIGSTLLASMVISSYALLLFCAKKLAQALNAKDYTGEIDLSGEQNSTKLFSTVAVTAPKHQTLSTDPQHLSTLVSYYARKKPSIVPPDEETLAFKTSLDRYVTVNTDPF